MANYRFLRILGGDPDGGIVIKVDKAGGEGYNVPSDHVYEIGTFESPEGRQMGIQRFDTLPYVGEKIMLNQSVIVFETQIPANSVVIKFIEDGNAKAAEKASGLILH